MSRGRRPRGLSAEERALWQQVAESAEPLTRRITKPAEEPAEPPVPRPPAPPAANPPPARSRAPAPAAVPGSIDRKTRVRLSRGIIAVDGRLDLHGLTQTAAHHRLHRFLADAQANGERLVLVITGKGKADDSPRVEERGVLRRAVPDWLESPEFRPLVAGFDEAGRRHGGAGALYVRVRRKR